MQAYTYLRRYPLDVWWYKCLVRPTLNCTRVRVAEGCATGRGYMVCMRAKSPLAPADESAGYWSLLTKPLSDMQSTSMSSRAYRVSLRSQLRLNEVYFTVIGEWLQPSSWLRSGECTVLPRPFDCPDGASTGH